MASLAIGEVARRSGITTSAIRYYESEGLIPKVGRRGARRYYDESILDRLRLIELAKNAGFTIGEIKILMSGFRAGTPAGERWRAMTREKMAELDARIAETKRMQSVLRTVVRCRCPSLDDCGRALRRHGERS